MDRKQIAKELDWAADRSEVPASSKQCWFLAGLMAAAGDTPDAIFGNIAVSQRALSKKKASFYIDEYANRPNKVEAA